MSFIIDRLKADGGRVCARSATLSQRSRVWPYVLILGCLFVMALVAPHGWDHFGQTDLNQPIKDNPAETVAGPAGNTGGGTALVVPAQNQSTVAAAPADSITPTASTSRNSDAVVSDTLDPSGDGWQFDAAAGLNESKHTQVDSTKAASYTAGPALGLNSISQASAVSVPVKAETSAAPNAAPALEALHRDVSVVGEMLANEFSNTLRSLQAKAKASNLAQVPQPATLNLFPYVAAKSKATDVVAQPRPIPVLKSTGKPSHARATDAEPNFGTANATDLLSSESANSASAPNAWPVPKSLLDSLDALSKQDDSDIRDWAINAIKRINELDRLPPHAVPQAAKLLDELRRLAEQADPLALHVKQIQTNFAIHRVQYALVRRLDIWDVVCQQRATALAASGQSPLNRRRMEIAISDVNAMAGRNGEATGLREHLMLDTLAELAHGDEEATAEDRRHVAREVRMRIAARRQAAGRESLAEERPLAELDRQLRRWAAGSAKLEPTEGQELMALVERFESSDSIDDAHRLAQWRIELASSTNAADNDLGRRLEMHYRNANFRIVLSNELINRLLPAQAPVQSPVNDIIVGSVVQGQSTTSTELHVHLLPSAQSWQIAFEADGNVASETSATSGPVTFMNRGAAQFHVQKRITVDAAGIHAEPSSATVTNNTMVEGIETQYDSLPIFRSFVRNYAMSEREDREAQANQETEDKIRKTACSRVDSQIEPRLAKLTQKFRDQLDPFEKLGLAPTIATLETSDIRLTARTRLAATDQLAAYTPRPDAPGGSLASMQIHESAVNNLLDRFELAGRKFTLPELISYLNDRLGRTGKSLSDDLPQGVEITFAKSEPLRIRCNDGRIELAINIAEIRQGKHRWHDFEVRTAYRAEAHGLSAQLERDGTIELGGQYKGKTELALRGIFSKVFSRDRKFNLLPGFVSEDPRLANLQVTQLAVADGWIAVAIGPASTVAGRPQSVRRY